jgi:hypothetical protein
MSAPPEQLSMSSAIRALSNKHHTFRQARGSRQSQPASAGNAAVVDAISAREPDFSKSVVFKNETGRFGAAMAGPVPQDKRDATLQMPEVKAAVLGN